jgi:L-alanine-DL-glutamate epimerase-like enolase superfamily enzyme
MKLVVERRDVGLVLPYTYSRGHDLSCALVQVRLEEDGVAGRGEGAPFESFFGVPATETLEQLEAVRPAVERGVSNRELLSLLPAGPARNALDAALWDLEAKRSSTPVWRLLGLHEPAPIEIMTTVSLAGDEQLGHELEASREHPVLKLKLGSDTDVERLELTRAVRPDADLVVDVNGAWDVDRLREMLPVLARHDVRMVEEPVSGRHVSGLRDLPRSIPLVADESFSSPDDLPRLAGLYDGVSIKLDKCGGLTAALEIVERARPLGLKVMVGCLPATSLSSAVGFHLAGFAEFVDLDNHLWVTEDTEPALVYRDGWLEPPLPELWG